VSYNSVMNGYARLLEQGGGGGSTTEEFDEGLESVMRILKRMEDLSNVTPADYNDNDEGKVGEGGGSAAGNKKNRFVRPTIVTWNTVMRTLAKHGYGSKAEELLITWKKSIKQDPIGI